MGPTQQASSLGCHIKDSAACNYNSNSTNNPILNNNNKTFTLRKLSISQDVLDVATSSMKAAVSVIQKLSNLSVPEELIQYGKPWFEGPLAEECCQLTELIGTKKPSSVKVKEADAKSLDPISTTTEPPTFLCVPVESYDYVSLQSWLNDRDSKLLFESQVFHIVLKLIAGVNYIEEQGLKKFCKSVISLSDVHILVQRDTSEPQYAQDVLLPRVKLANVDLERVLSLKDPQDEPEIDITKTSLKCIAHLFLELLQRSKAALDMHGTDKSLLYSEEMQEEMQIIEEMLNCEIKNDTFQVINSKLKRLKSKYSTEVVLKIPEPQRHFIDKGEKVKQLNTMISELTNGNIFIIQGLPGSGKSELVSQLSKVLVTRQTNIICLNASDGDSLRRTTRYCMTHPQLRSISRSDHMGNPRSLKDIFQDMLHYFTDKKLLVVLDHVNVPTEEVSDFLQTFKENCKCEASARKGHTLVLLTTQAWPANNAENYVEMFPSTITLPDIAQYLKIKCNVSRDIEVLSKIGQNILPATLNILAKLMTTSLESFNRTFETFFEKFQTLDHLKSDNDSSSLMLAYSISLNYVLELLNEPKKILMQKILQILQHCDGDYGLHIDTLCHIIRNLSEVTRTFSEESLPDCLNSLQKFGLIEVMDGTVKLPDWIHITLRKAMQLLCSIDTKEEAELLSSSTALMSGKEQPTSCKSILIFHIAKMWTHITKLSPDLAKQFDHVPAIIAQLAVSNNKFEELTSFLKHASDTFAAVYSDPNHFHVLNLKYLFAVHALLPMSRVNEAFITLKLISEHSRTETREFLQLKLKSLIEVGQIHTARQEYEKAISCFQRVQVFAAQKIPILELDSEPTVLKSRMMHGYAHLQQGNSGEGKKILLQVVPLLERYSGKETSQVQMLLLRAKFYLATVLRKCGDLVTALMMQTKVLQETERIFGKKHPDVWESTREMAMLYSSYDNHEKALQLLRELLEVQEEVLGAPSNRQSLATMSSIAEIESRLGNFDDALELYEAIDLIEQQVLPENDHMRITSQVNQADVLMALGQYKEAIDIFDLICALIQSSPDNQTQSRQQELYQELLSKKEKSERSMEILGNYWLSLTPENVDDPSELAALAKKHEVATELSENQDNHGALRFLREIFEDCGHLDETNRFHLNVKADLARVLGLVGRFNESFSVYKEILPLMDATFGETDELTMLCKDTMGQVFLFSGNQFLKRQMSNLKWFLL